MEKSFSLCCDDNSAASNEIEMSDSQKKKQQIFLRNQDIQKQFMFHSSSSINSDIQLVEKELLTQNFKQFSDRWVTFRSRAEKLPKTGVAKNVIQISKTNIFLQRLKTSINLEPKTTLIKLKRLVEKNKICQYYLLKNIVEGKIK